MVEVVCLQVAKCRVYIWSGVSHHTVCSSSHRLRRLCRGRAAKTRSPGHASSTTSGSTMPRSTPQSEARRTPKQADAAALVLARAHLERFRQSANPADLTAARDGLKQIDPARLAASDRVELMIGLGELLYFDDQAGAAAEEFELALGRVDQQQLTDRERVLDWWASALDRQAQIGPASEQRTLYTSIVARMDDELRRNPDSAVASYWLVAGARGSGDLERAWDAAIAGWVRASLAGPGASGMAAATGRGASGAPQHLDRIVNQAIIPERARESSPSEDSADRWP